MQRSAAHAFHSYEYISHCSRKLEIDATPAVEYSLESMLQAYCHWHAIDALVVVARSRCVHACRCDAVDAPAGCETGT